MVRYWKFDITSDDGIRLKYPFDTKQVFGEKYHKIIENFGVGGGVVVRRCICKSNDGIDLSSVATEVTQLDYDSYDDIQLKSDKSQINADGLDGVVLSVKSPSPRGVVRFDITMPDGTTKLVKKTLDSNGNASVGGSVLASSITGTIEIKASCEGIHSKVKQFQTILIDAV